MLGNVINNENEVAIKMGPNGKQNKWCVFFSNFPSIQSILRLIHFLKENSFICWISKKILHFKSLLHRPIVFFFAKSTRVKIFSYKSTLFIQKLHIFSIISSAKRNRCLSSWDSAHVNNSYEFCTKMIFHAKFINEIDDPIIPFSLCTFLFSSQTSFRSESISIVVAVFFL